LSNHINRVFEKLKQEAQMRKHIVAFGRELPESLVDSLQEEFEVTVISQPILALTCRSPIGIDAPMRKPKP
jgi:hypothetical protein